MMRSTPAVVPDIQQLRVPGIQLQDQINDEKHSGRGKEGDHMMPVQNPPERRSADYMVLP